MTLILVVDDEYGLAETLASVLEDVGYRTLLAQNGQQALERMAEQRPDLVLTDLMMPVMDGRTLVERMRQSPALAPIPVLMMSAVDPLVVARDLPGLPFLRKPFNLDELLKRVEQVLAGARAAGG